MLTLPRFVCPATHHGAVGASPSTTISSASESGAAPTARDLQRVKRGLARATETLRESLAGIKGRLWEAIDDEVVIDEAPALEERKVVTPAAVAEGRPLDSTKDQIDF